MKLASYNVENLFQRAHAMNLPDSEDGREALTMHAEINGILNKKTYSAADKQRIVALMKELGIEKTDDGGQFVILRQNRGHLVKRPQAGGLQIVANGRSDWIGFVDLKMEAVNEVATRMTAKVIRTVNADVIGLVEAESRPSLIRFHDQIMKPGGITYEHIMLIDGNDERGIDVGIMTRGGFDIESMRSHVDDAANGNRIFSRDCAEYHIKTPSGQDLFVLVNHFKSKGFGSQASSNKKRMAQADRVKAIYNGLVQQGAKNVAVIGDFNDTPNSNPLAPLLQNTNLKDIATHPTFNDGGRPGTFGNSTATNKIDYILLSPPLFQKVIGGEIFRMGIWGGTNGTLFPHFPEITKAAEAASDHAAITAEINLT